MQLEDHLRRPAAALARAATPAISRICSAASQLGVDTDSRGTLLSLYISRMSRQPYSNPGFFDLANWRQRIAAGHVGVEKNFKLRAIVMGQEGLEKTSHRVGVKVWGDVADPQFAIRGWFARRNRFIPQARRA